MMKRRFQRWQQLAKPVHGLSALLVGSALLTTTLLVWSAASQNRLAEAYGVRIANTAMANFSHDVELIARDYGYWIDAYENLVAAPDLA